MFRTSLVVVSVVFACVAVAATLMAERSRSEVAVAKP